MATLPSKSQRSDNLTRLAHLSRSSAVTGAWGQERYLGETTPHVRIWGKGDKISCPNSRSATGHRTDLTACYQASLHPVIDTPASWQWVKLARITKD